MKQIFLINTKDIKVVYHKLKSSTISFAHNVFVLFSKYGIYTNKNNTLFTKSTKSKTKICTVYFVISAQYTNPLIFPNNSWLT